MRGNSLAWSRIGPLGGSDPSSNLGFPTFFIFGFQITIMQRSAKPDWQQKIAKERIDILFGLAEKNLNMNLKRSQRYVELARKIGTRYNVRFSKEAKRKFCKNCNTLLKGTKAKVRTEGKSLIIKCQNCNKIYRYPYK